MDKLLLAVLLLSAFMCSVDCSGHNESCETTENCITDDPNLLCMDHVCLCDPVNYVFDNTRDSCVGLVGTPCLSDSRCITGTECVTTCRCLDSYIPNSIRRCNLGHSAPCRKYTNNVTDMSTCGEDFVCIDGKCECPFSYSQKLVNSRDSRCHSLVAGHCDTGEDCVPNAECQENSCACAAGYSENINGDCVLDYGSPCNYSNPGTIELDTLNICDPLVPLKCYGGQCSCLDPSSVFYAPDRTCRLPIGARCSPTPDKGDKCVEGAFCEPNISPQLAGRCQYSPLETTPAPSWTTEEIISDPQTTPNNSKIIKSEIITSGFLGLLATLHFITLKS